MIIGILAMLIFALMGLAGILYDKGVR